MPLDPAEGTSPVNTLILTPKDSFHSSDLQEYKSINVGCFKPLNLWLFVIAAIETPKIAIDNSLGQRIVSSNQKKILT